MEIANTAADSLLFEFRRALPPAMITSSDWRGQVNINQILMQRATMTGFITGDHPDKVQPGLAYLAGLLAEGRLHHDETIIEGFDRMLEALGVLFAGGNTGKLIVHVADPR